MGKFRELRDMLREVDDGVEFLSLQHFPNYKAPPENGTTFEENAVLKATDAARQLNHLALSDDSGLVVPALDDEPGVYSARYAGPNATDADNRKHLLANMRHLTDLQRQAYFACGLAVADPSGLLLYEESHVEGEILTEQRGSGGFGYDPLFLKHGYSHTFAELDEATKNRVSHRRKAIDRIAPRLSNLLACST
jgi:XTP/dITP diphosphohydrolase